MNDILQIVGLIAASGAAAAAVVAMRQSGRTATHAQRLAESFVRLENQIKDEFSRNRTETARSAKEGREELAAAVNNLAQQLLSRLHDTTMLQKKEFEGMALQLTRLTQSNEERLENLRQTVDARLVALQTDNNAKLEKMRETVDEKLHKTLEARLGESFKLVSERLELVHKGLGEMQTLAVGVGDLKRTLSNVKTRGVLGEYQLGNLLEQLLAPDQYGANVKTKAGSAAIVEFAVRLPGRSDGEGTVWLPLDSKFPVEDYHILQDAQGRGDAAAVEEASKRLAARVRLFAKDIRDKYIDPPGTTDFGIMFLPFEGLYAEVLRHPGLFEVLQREYKVIVTGPTTLSAFLNSLQMGFRTLAIEKRSSEVWELLGAVKTEFGRFGAVLDKTQKKLQEASNVIEQAGVRSRAIERRLRTVQQMPSDEAALFFDELAGNAPDEAE